MFGRKIISQLIEWAENPRRKPLVLRGARQVGKITIVKMFSSQFDQFIYLNLEISKDRKIFESDLSFDQFLDVLLLSRNIEKITRVALTLNLALDKLTNFFIKYVFNKLIKIP